MRAHSWLSGVNGLKGTNYPESYLKFQSAPRSKHTLSPLQKPVS